MSGKPKFSFAEYYKNNPEFQKRHKEKLAQLVTCEICGKSVQKGYLYKHKTLNICKKKACKDQNKNEDNKNELALLYEQIQELKKLIIQKP